MPILKPSSRSEKIQIRIAVEKKLVDEMTAYCKWAGLEKTDDFIEQAIQLVLEKDKEWRAERAK